MPTTTPWEAQVGGHQVTPPTSSAPTSPKSLASSGCNKTTASGLDMDMSANSKSQSGETTACSPPKKPHVVALVEISDSSVLQESSGDARSHHEDARPLARLTDVRHVENVIDLFRKRASCPYADPHSHNVRQPTARDAVAPKEHSHCPSASKHPLVTVGRLMRILYVFDEGGILLHQLPYTFSALLCVLPSESSVHDEAPHDTSCILLSSPCLFRFLPCCKRSWDFLHPPSLCSTFWVASTSV